MGTYLPGVGEDENVDGASTGLPPRGGRPPFDGGRVITVTFAGPGSMPLTVYLPSTISAATTRFSPDCGRNEMVPEGSGAPLYFTSPVTVARRAPHPDADTARQAASNGSRR